MTSQDNTVGNIQIISDDLDYPHYTLQSTILIFGNAAHKILPLMIPCICVLRNLFFSQLNTHTHTPVFLSFHMNGSVHIQDKEDNETVLRFSLGQPQLPQAGVASLGHKAYLVAVWSFTFSKVRDQVQAFKSSSRESSVMRPSELSFTVSRCSFHRLPFLLFQQKCHRINISFVRL